MKHDALYMNALMIKRTMPAPTIVPTNVAESRAIPVTFWRLSSSVGTRETAITTAMIEVTKPVMYSLISSAPAIGITLGFF